MVITYTVARARINRVKFPILLVVSSTGKMNISLSPFAPENLVSRDGFGSPVPRHPALLNTQAEYGAYLRDSSRVPRRHPNTASHTPSGQFRVYRVTQLRTDGVHCREFAGTGPVNPKVVPSSERVLPWQVTMDHLICASLSHQFLTVQYYCCIYIHIWSMNSNLSKIFPAPIRNFLGPGVAVSKFENTVEMPVSRRSFLLRELSKITFSSTSSS